MRINVYAEEITERVEIVEKTADTGSHFIGLRFYLRSPPELHHTDKDDDSSAVTFWVRSSKDGFKNGDTKALRRVLKAAMNALWQAEGMHFVDESYEKQREEEYQEAKNPLVFK